MASGARGLPASTGDFADVLALFQQRGLVADPAPPNLVTHARNIHHATYSLIQWMFRLRGLTPHAKPFVNEIASDALQILPHTLAGYAKSAKLLTRGIIENTLRHVYFSDHPIEFTRMNRERKWFLTQDELMAYAKAHPVLMEAEPRFDALAKLSSLYTDLSAVVHGRTINHLQMKTALEHISYDDASASEQARVTKQCAESVNYVLACFHKQRVERLQVDERRIILRSMSPDARRAWGDL